MNNERRKQIANVIKMIEDAQTAYLALRDTMNDAKELLETIKTEEEEYRENIPESLHGSEKYYDSEAASSQLDTAFEIIETISDALYSDFDDVVTALDEAKC